jgi:subfamily B ATP-binding cassette protein MsbA
VLEALSFILLLKALAFLTHPNENQGFILLVVLFVSCQVFKAFCSFCAAYFIDIQSCKVSQKAQKAVFKQILCLSYPFVNRYSLGELTEYLKGPDSFIPLLFRQLNQAILSLVMMLASLFVMAKISGKLTLIMGILFSIAFVFQKKVIKKIQKNSLQLTRRLELFCQETLQYLSGIKLIHTYKNEASILQKVDHNFQSIFQVKVKNFKHAESIHWFNQSLGSLLIGLGMISCFFMLQRSNHLMVDLIAFIAITYRLSSKIIQFISILTSIHAHFGRVVQLGSFLKTQDKEFVDENKDKEPLKMDHIRLSNLTFTYPYTEKTVLKNISLTIQKKSTVAIVGPSGSGKSTLLDLIMGLYPIKEKSSLSMGGGSILDLHLENYRHQIGFVNQDTFILNDSVIENIRFGNKDVTDHEVKKAAKLSKAHDFITQLSKGYQTILGERGYRLSGGERQRIALARALVRDPKLLILDEATSNLDSFSERAILEALKSYHGQKTIIIVTHRLSTIKEADQIYVLEKGEIKEMGSHESLIKSPSLYQSLWRLQSEKKEASTSFEPA